MVRYLTERLPFMLAPRWITNEVQPIAVRDVLTYLMAARTREPLGVIDIGGRRPAQLSRHAARSTARCAASSA